MWFHCGYQPCWYIRRYIANNLIAERTSSVHRNLGRFVNNIHIIYTYRIIDTYKGLQTWWKVIIFKRDRSPFYQFKIDTLPGINTLLLITNEKKTKIQCNIWNFKNTISIFTAIEYDDFIKNKKNVFLIYLNIQSKFKVKYNCSVRGSSRQYVAQKANRFAIMSAITSKTLTYQVNIWKSSCKSCECILAVPL